MHQCYEVTRNFVYEEGLPGEEVLGSNQVVALRRDA